MKGTKGISLLSAACLALTGLAGGFPLFSAETPAVYAAAVKDIPVIPETAMTQITAYFDAMKTCEKAYTDINAGPDPAFYHAYVSDVLRKAGEKDTVSFAVYKTAAEECPFTPQNLKEKLTALKVYDSAKDTVKLAAENADAKNLKNRLWWIDTQEDPDGVVYTVYGTTNELKTGKPKAEDSEFADYCDCSADGKQYYSIGTPVVMEIRQNLNGTFFIRRYEKTDRYTAGGRLYVVSHSEELGEDYKTVYAPVDLKMQFRDAETGKLTDAAYQLYKMRLLDERTQSYYEVNVTVCDVIDDSGNLRLEFPGEDTAFAFERLWKTVDGEFKYEAMPGEKTTVEAVCKDAKGSRDVKDNLVQSSGDTELTFTITKDPQLVTSDQLSSLFTQVGWYYSEVVQDGGDFQTGEAAPDSLVMHMTEDALYKSPYKSELTEIKETIQVLRYYTVPYKTYMEYADQLFAKHSDLKEILGERYDSKTDTVKVYVTFSGSGGLDTANVMVDYVEKDGLFIVRGAKCTPESEMTGYTISDNAVENVDYFTKEYPQYSVRYMIGTPMQMTVRRSDLGYQIVSYTQTEMLRIGDVLTRRFYTPDATGLPKYVCNIYSPVRVTVTDNATGLPAETKTELNSRTGALTVTTADGKIKVASSSGTAYLYDGLAWRFPVEPLTFTVTGACTVNGIDGKTLKATGKENTYELAAKDGMAEFTVSVGREPERGDLSGDGDISVDDAQLTLKAYTKSVAGLDNGLNPAQEKAADINGDGEVSVDDAQLILKYYTQKKVAGKDITWDDLLKK